MNKHDYLLRYSGKASFQLAVIRSQEAFWMNQIKMGKPILDIGCSDGVFGEILFGGKEGAIEKGVDLDKLALRFCQDKGVYKGVIKADARDLPFEKETFATVIANSVLEHIDGINQALEEISRVLKPKGKLVFLVPTVWVEDYWMTRFSKTLGRFKSKVLRHKNVLSVDDWEKRLQNFSLKLISFRYLGSRRRYLISDFLVPVRLFRILVGGILKQNFLFPRQPAIVLAGWLKGFVEKGDTDNQKKGPTVLIVAQKVKL